jgi:hypothetical protein
MRYTLALVGALSTASSPLAASRAAAGELRGAFVVDWPAAKRGEAQ